MKKLFRIEDFLVSFISAIGWGIGYAIPKTWGFSELICIVSCIFMGLFMGILGNKLPFLRHIINNIPMVIYSCYTCNKNGKIQTTGVNLCHTWA